MKINIESTDKLTTIGGVRVRLWEGKTQAGAKCKVFVHRIAVHNDEDQSQFEKELTEQMQPGQMVELRHIL